MQKVALRIILKENYFSYIEALKFCNLPTLFARRESLCKNFAKKCVKNSVTRDMFPVNVKHYNTRHAEKYKVTSASTDRLKKSAIPHMQNLLNKL